MAQDVEKLLLAGPGNEQALIEIFEMKEAEAKKRRKLSTVTKGGSDHDEESWRGGARKCAICRLQVATLSVGGAPRMWRLLGVLEAQAVEAEVTMLQETRVTEDEWRAVERRAARLRYDGHRLAGATYRGRWGEARVSGGVATLGKKGVRQQTRGEKKVGDAQALAVEVQGRDLRERVRATTYTRGFLREFGSDSDRATDSRGQSVLEGRFQRDFKRDSDDSSGKFRISSGARQGCPPLPTRWPGTERIDYFMTTRSWEVERSGVSKLKLSDHCLVRATVNIKDCEAEPTTKIHTGGLESTARLVQTSLEDLFAQGMGGR